MSKKTNKPTKPRKPPPWLEATKARLRAKGASPLATALADPTRIDEPVEGLTALFDEALRRFPGEVELAKVMAWNAWNHLAAAAASVEPVGPAELWPEALACYQDLLALRQSHFSEDLRTAMVVRVIERDGGWAIRARMIDLG